MKSNLIHRWAWLVTMVCMTVVPGHAQVGTRVKDIAVISGARPN